MPSYRINDSLYLVSHPVNKASAPPKPVEVPVDHILVYDCSGSMYYDLPKIREQVKKKLPKMLGPNDRLSMVWFSGRGEYGTLLEAEPVATLADLKTIEQTIDRWLRPVGMTGFKQPLEEVAALAQRLAKTGGNRVRSMMFFTDGCDNQWTQNDVLKAVEGAAGQVQSATFVEYGYYANRPLLAQMAEKSGGSLIFAESFDRYEPQFEAFVKRKQSGAPRVEVTIKGDAIGGFAYALVDGDLVTFSVNGDKISVPKDLSEVFYLAPSCIGNLDADLTAISGSIHKSDGVFTGAAKLTPNPERMLAAAYAAISLFAVRMKPDVVFPLLKATGDVTLIKQFTNCFGKQKYSEFMDAAKSAAFNSSERFTDGYNPNLVPREDAFTVLDVLSLLQKDSSARILINDMKYSPIGRGRVDATDQLTEEEQAKVDELTAEMGKTKDAKKVKALAEQIAAITDKPEALKFVRNVPKNGLPLLSLTFNEDRPNVSFLVKIPGTIDLSKRIEASDVDLTGVPSNFNCFVFRNYTVIKDGLVNIDRLPVVMSVDSLKALQREGVSLSAGYSDGSPTATVVIDLKALPVINRKMIRELSAKTFFETAYELTKAKAAQKVYKDVAKQFLPEKKNEGFAAKYGDAPAAWLKEQGITDYNGFQPPSTTQAPSTDVYTGKELKVSLKGLSTLPKVADVTAKLASGGKLNAPGALMAEAVKDVQAFMASAAYTKATDQQLVLQTWLNDRTDGAIAKARALILEIAKNTFCTVVGQVWFKEFSSIDESTYQLTTSDGTTVQCEVEMKEIEIRI